MTLPQTTLRSVLGDRGGPRRVKSDMKTRPPISLLVENICLLVSLILITIASLRMGAFPACLAPLIGLPLLAIRGLKLVHELSNWQSESNEAPCPNPQMGHLRKDPHYP